MAEQRVEEDRSVIDARVVRGARALPGLPSPDRERLGSILDDIPRALGVTFVSPLFTALATWPEWFEDAWPRTAPQIGGREWREATGRVRALARAHVSTEPGDAPVAPELARYLGLLDTLLPGLLVLACAWYAAPARDDEVEPAAAPGAPSLDTATAPKGEVGPEDELLLAELTSAHGHPRVLSVYRAIAAGGPLFGAEAPALIARAADPAHDALRTGLRDAARTGRLASGVTAPPEGAAEILALFGARLIPDLILDTTWLRVRAGLEGASA